jgi:hypothetical protein
LRRVDFEIDDAGAFRAALDDGFSGRVETE